MQMEIKAKDIVSASDGEVSFQTAGKWLKSVNPSIAVKYALMYFRLKLGSAEIFSDKVRGQYGGMVVEFGPAKVEMNQGFYSPEAVLNTIKEKKTASQKIPAKRTHVILSATGHNSWGSDKTYKFVGALLRVNFGGKAYNALNVNKLPDDFIIEGITHPVSEFANVG